MKWSARYSGVMVILLVCLVSVLSFGLMWYQDVYIYVNGDVWQTTTLDLDFVEVGTDYCVLNYLNCSIEGVDVNCSIVSLDKGKGRVLSDTRLIDVDCNGSGLMWFNVSNLYSAQYYCNVDGVTVVWFNSSVTAVSVSTTLSTKNVEVWQVGEVVASEDVPAFGIVSLLMPLLWLLMAVVMIIGLYALPLNMAFKVIIMAFIVIIIATNVVPHLFA